MRLLIISHTPHYMREGVLVGWGPTVREIDALSVIFDQIVHIAPLHPGFPPASSLSYQSSKVLFRSVPPAGGFGIAAKFNILTKFPVYTYAFFSELRLIDVIHVRCPANISMISIIILAFLSKPTKRWVKYAGNWKPTEREPLLYKFQRWWLKRRLQGGVVTVNGNWPGQPWHVYPFLNPCLTEQEINNSKRLAFNKELLSPLRLIFIGRLETSKGIGRALDIFAKILKHGLCAILDIVGDGPESANFHNQVIDLKIDKFAKFHGWLPRQKLGTLLAQSHIMLFPTRSEGWPKVLSEAMAYGVVPLTSNVSCIPQYLRKFGTGKTFKFDALEKFTNAILWYFNNPAVWKRESESGVMAAAYFSYSNYIYAVQNLLGL